MATYTPFSKNQYLKSVLIFLFCVCSLGVFSQGIPNGFTYQGIARDELGNPVVSKKIILEISIYAGEPSSSSAKPEWQELHETTTNEEGFFSLVIGEGVSTTKGTQTSFAVIDWKKASYYMNVRADFGVKDFGNGLVSMGVVKLQAVPYAFWSKNANIADSLRALTLSKLLGVKEADIVKDNVITWNGTKWTVAAGGGNNFVKIDGTSDLTGNWTISTNNITLQNGTLSTKQLKLGSTSPVSSISTDVELGGTAANNLTLSTQYAVKQYVDGKIGGSFWSANGNSMLYNTDRLIGIGTSTPAAKFHANVAKDVFLVTGLDNSEKETRMAFFGNLAAFRTGKVNGTQWDLANVGLYSSAFGEDNIASGMWSSAFGYGNKSLTSYCFTAGFSNIANGEISFAGGNGNLTEGNSSFAFGNQNSTSVNGRYAFVVGNSNQGNAEGGFAAGNSTTANGKYSAAFGYSSSTEAQYCAAFGESARALGQASMSMGVGTYSRTYGEVVLGMYNTIVAPANVNSTSQRFDSDRLLVVGNGTSTTRKDALMILKNGNVGIGISVPTYTLQVAGTIYATGSITQASDIRFKKNIVGINNSLDKVLKIKGVYYDWKKEEFPERQFSDAKQIGFIAQDLENILPEVVSTDINGYKSVDYSKLTPLLIEALKEQQVQLEALKKENTRMKAELSQSQDLKDKVNNLEKKVNVLIQLIEVKNTTQK